jgi:hypothetical protein
VGADDDHVDTVFGDVLQYLFVRIPLRILGLDGESRLRSRHLDVSQCLTPLVPECCP